jgi:hypothetical protein
MADPLVGLRDWHLPEPVAWWPPAPGWWLVAALVMIAVVLGWALWRRRRQGAAVRAALSRLTALNQAFQIGGDQRRFAAEVSQLLRRLALIRYPRERVAGLTGSAWLTFLDATGGGDGFTQGSGRVLADRPYRAPGDPAPRAGDAAPTAQLDLDPVAVADLATRWIRAQQETTP